MRKISFWNQERPTTFWPIASKSKILPSLLKLSLEKSFSVTYIQDTNLVTASLQLLYLQLYAMLLAKKRNRQVPQQNKW